MPGLSAIGWTNYTWNFPIMGCTRVSPGCDNCYAAAIVGKWHALQENGHWRSGNSRPVPIEYQAPFEQVRRMRAVMPESAWRKRLDWPRMLERRALRTGERPMVFVNSMTDAFHSAVTAEDLQLLFGVMRECPHVIFQVLTKRPARMVAVTLKQWADDMSGLDAPIIADWPTNVWAGTSVESDPYTPRVNHLRHVQGGDARLVRFVSLEPLLGPLPRLDLTGIDQAIVGAESGPGARPMALDWVRAIRDECARTGTALFFKQTWEQNERGRWHKNTAPRLDGRVWQEYPRYPKKEVA